MPILIEVPDMIQTVKLCEELGLSFIELNMNIPEFCHETLSSELVRNLSARESIEFTLHLPEEIDLASFHPAIRQAHMARCLEAIRWAHEAGICLINMHIHSGIYFTLSKRKIWIYDKYQRQFLDNVTSALDILLKAAKTRV